MENTRTSEFFKDYQNSKSPKDECNLRSFNNSRVHVISNRAIHDKIMQN